MRKSIGKYTKSWLEVLWDRLSIISRVWGVGFNATTRSFPRQGRGPQPLSLVLGFTSYGLGTASKQARQAYFA